jgi:hypothetical protein
LNEHLLYQRLKPIFQNVGLCIRLENSAATSVPDMVLIRQGVTLWLELKIVKSKKITMPKFQFAFGVKLEHELSDLFQILAWHREELIAINYEDVIEFAQANGHIVEYDIESAPYTDIPNLKEWLLALMR